jgi:Regulator of G protein signaling domain
MNPFGNHSTPSSLPQIDEERPPKDKKQRVYPTLNEVLNNTAAPPYTLSSFMAYLSMMHSLETLEFLLDASRYRTEYKHTVGNLSSDSIPATDIERLQLMWYRLIDAYIEPGGSRQVNLPSSITEPLLHTRAEFSPPEPDLLDSSTTHVYNLMRDGVLASFIAHCDVLQAPPITKKPTLKRPSMFRHNSTSSAPISIPYPISPQRRTFPTSVSSVDDESWEEGAESDDAEMSSSGRMSPMTPPLTPPPQDSPAKEGGTLWGWRVREKLRLGRR